MLIWSSVRKLKPFLTLILLTIMVLGICFPVKALGDYELTTSNSGVSEYSTAQAHSGSRSVKLATPGSADQGRIKFDGQGLTLSQITSLSYWSYVETPASGNDRIRPYIAIYLDGDGDTSTWEYYMQAEPVYTVYPAPGVLANLGTWEFWDAYDATNPLRWQAYELVHGGFVDLPYESPFLQDYITGAAVSYSTIAHGIQQFATIPYGPLTVITIDFRAGYGGTWSGFVGYVDDVEINTASEVLQEDFDPAPPPHPYIVGGIIIPSNNLALLAPYLTLVGLAVTVTTTTVVVIKKIRKT